MNKFINKIELYDNDFREKIDIHLFLEIFNVLIFKSEDIFNFEKKLEKKDIEFLFSHNVIDKKKLLHEDEIKINWKLIYNFYLNNETNFNNLLKHINEEKIKFLESKMIGVENETY